MVWWDPAHANFGVKLFIHARIYLYMCRCLLSPLSHYIEASWIFFLPLLQGRIKDVVKREVSGGGGEKVVSVSRGEK